MQNKKTQTMRRYFKATVNSVTYNFEMIEGNVSNALVGLGMATVNSAQALFGIYQSQVKAIFSASACRWLNPLVGINGASCKLAMLVPAILMGGCANFTEAISIQKTFDSDAPSAYSIGAKQRVILSNPGSDRDGKKFARLCAEPSPDVFSALAASVSTEASAEKGAAQLGLAAKLAGGFSEGASTIERTQTLNLLRETMYRSCERYLNGAIGDDEFVIQAARDQRMAVTVLAIEQLTGVVKSNANALTAVARAAVAGNPATLLADAKKNLGASETLLKEAAKDVVDKPDLYDCTGKSKDSKAGEEKKKDYESACRAYKQDAAHYDLMVKLSAANTSLNVDQQTYAITNSAYKSEPIVNTNLLQTVKEIVELNNKFPEGLMFCITKLRGQSKWNELPSEVQKACEKLISAQLGNDTEQNLKLAASARLTTTELEKVQVLSANQTAIERSQLQGPWGVVFGGDKTLSAAQDEIRNAGKWGLSDPRIYFRDGVYRSVSYSADGAAAQVLLRIAIASVPKRQPYLVNLATWCMEPSQSTEAGANVTRCK